MLFDTNYEHDKIWNILKHYKITINNAEIGDTNEFEMGCQQDTALNSYMIMKGQLENVEKHLNMKSTDIVYANITTEILHTAAKMYLYINACTNPLQHWFTFFIDLLQNKTPDVIFLTLNRILKESMERSTLRYDKEMKSIAKLLLKNISKYDEIHGLFSTFGQSYSSEVETGSFDITDHIKGTNLNRMPMLCIRREIKL